MQLRVQEEPVRLEEVQPGECFVLSGEGASPELYGSLGRIGRTVYIRTERTLPAWTKGVQVSRVVPSEE